MSIQVFHIPIRPFFLTVSTDFPCSLFFILQGLRPV